MIPLLWPRLSLKMAGKLNGSYFESGFDNQAEDSVGADVYRRLLRRNTPRSGSFSYERYPNCGTPGNCGDVRGGRGELDGDSHQPGSPPSRSVANRSQQPR